MSAATATSRIPALKPLRAVAATCHVSTSRTSWYPPLIAAADAVGRQLLDGQYPEAAAALLARLEPDDYARYLSGFIADGRERFGQSWAYADIVTTLLCLSDLIRPATYLEIGVRRGRSLCAVASRAPECRLIGFDLWVDDYAGMPNPGPDFVRSELAKVGHRGAVELIDGDSHRTVPAFLAAEPDLPLDLVTVDGDHSAEGAAADLRDVLPNLAVGGAVVFDDIAHPLHPELRDVWNDLVVRDPRFSSFSFTSVGFGVGFAFRRQ